MTDETDPFADLDESLGEEPEESTDESEASTNEDTGTATESENTTQMQTEQPETDDPEAKDRPAFPFDEAKQDALYARKDAWSAFEDALDFEVKRTLRERGHENITGRELHDAALRVMANNPDAVADEVERQRNDIA